VITAASPQLDALRVLMHALLPSGAPATQNAFTRTAVMPKGDKSSYTDKQKRQAKHIEKSEEDEGKSKKTAERIAYATVNKKDGGGKKK
jgi:hypothetical protein